MGGMGPIELVMIVFIWAVPAAALGLIVFAAVRLALRRPGPPPPPGLPASAAFCSHCGSTLMDRARFCGACGSALLGSPSEPSSN